MKEKKYSVFSNIAFIYKQLRIDHGFKIILMTVLIPVMGILTKSLGVALPSVAVYLISEGKQIGDYVIFGGGVIVLYGVLQIVENMIFQHYSISCTETRCFSYERQLMEKALTTDYLNWESYKNQKKIGRAGQALGGNWLGLERIYKECPQFLLNLLGMIIYGGAIITVDIRILIVLVLMLVCNIYTNKFARNFLEKTREEDSEIYRKENYMTEKSKNVKCGKDIRIYRMEKWFSKLMESYVEQGVKWQKSLEKHYYLPVFSDTVFIALRDGLAYIVLIHQFIQGEISITAFTLMLGVIAEFSNWLFGAVGAWNNVLDANKTIGDLRDVLSAEDNFLHGTGDVPDLKKAPEIEFKDVSFSYEDEDDKILSHISFRIAPGEKIALVGNNGAGKTTIVKLLCGFYQPVEGDILVNGISVKDYNIDEYFKLIGAVFQDMDEQAFSLLNIVSGRTKDDADISLFWDAVRNSGLADKINSLENKENACIDTVFDDKGIRLSGGEMQKLMLARCIYKNAPLLILDEPTAALDAIAESEMYEQYNNLTKDKSSIFISHRLASTRFCDRILFLENGIIAEEGSHEELMKQNGRYAKIYEVQSHYYKKENSSAEMEAAYEV